MDDRERFDGRLTDAVRAYADHARTQVDAAATAERAMAARGRSRGRALAPWFPAPVWLLIVLALLLIASAWAIGAGAPRDGRAPGLVPAVATPSAPVAASPTPTPDPLRAAHVSGASRLTLVSPGVTEQGGGDSRVTGIAYTLREDTDDARVAGSGTLTLDTAGTASMSYGSGQIRINGADGGWTGTCTSASWEEGRSISLTCWLAGTGSYGGLHLYLASLHTDGDGQVDGVVMAEPPPTT
jgi:hypothetical protein